MDNLIRAAKSQLMDSLTRAVEAAKGGKTYTRKEDDWFVKLNQLKAYKEEFGDCNAPYKYEPNNLGKWVQSQRLARSRGKLSQECIDLLDEIGFVWDKREKSWEEMFDKLKVFKEENGHCSVPLRLKPLGTWVNTQRDFYKHNRLSQQRITLLEEIGFVWNTKTHSWDDMYQKLIEYKEANGHTKVPRNDSNIALANWVSSQRDDYKRSKLTDERKSRLEEVGFDWGYRQDDRWLKSYEELKALKVKNGHRRVSSSTHPALEAWAGKQREEYKKSKLSDERKRLLNEIDFAWDPHNEAWDAMYQKMLEYKEEIGDCDVPKVSYCMSHLYAAHLKKRIYPTPNFQEYHLNPSLGAWVKNQRKCFKKKKLSQDRISRLQSVGFSFSMAGKNIKKPGLKGKWDPAWDKWFQKLLEYKEQNGDCLVPKGYPADVSLANWVRNTRQQHKRNELSEDRVCRLGEIGFAFSIGMGKYKRSGRKSGGQSIFDEEPTGGSTGLGGGQHLNGQPDVEFGVAEDNEQVLPELPTIEETDEVSAQLSGYANQNTMYWHAIQENYRLAEGNRHEDYENV